MAKILLLGSTGRTGLLTLNHALEKGHEVVALARSPKKITVTSSKLVVVEGSPDKPEDIKKAIVGCSAVISTMNNNRASDSPFAKPLNPEGFMTNIMASCLSAMKAEGVRRIVVMTAVGVGDSFEHSPWLFRVLIKKTNLGIAYRDHEGQERLLRESGLDWTIARPVGLSEKPNQKVLKVDYGHPAKPSMMIERAKVAKYLVDCLEDENSIGKTAMLFEAK